MPPDAAANFSGWFQADADETVTSNLCFQAWFFAD